MNLETAVVYDIETLANAFTMNVVGLFNDLDLTFEISPYRDHRELLFPWFCYWRDTQTPMIGFNSLYFDYSVIHEIYCNPMISVEEIYQRAQDLIYNYDRFNTIWESDRFAP